MKRPPSRITATWIVVTWMIFQWFAMQGLALAGQSQDAAARKPNPAFAKIVDDSKLPHVLLIGDSISIGYTVPVGEALKGKANVHRAPVNCGPTVRGLEQLDDWLAGGKWDVIHFNWWLHDLKHVDGKHQIPIDWYESNLRTLVGRLNKTGARLIWCATTPVPKGPLSPPRTDEDVRAYNRVAEAIMRDNRIEINDLYRFARGKLKEIQRKTNVHFTPSGSKVLAEEVAQHIFKPREGPPADK